MKPLPLITAMFLGSLLWSVAGYVAWVLVQGEFVCKVFDL
jgi:hypothetical protein